MCLFNNNTDKIKHYWIKSITHYETLKHLIGVFQHVFHINRNFLWLIEIFNNSLNKIIEWKTPKTFIEEKNHAESLSCRCLNCSYDSTHFKSTVHFVIDIVLNIWLSVQRVALTQFFNVSTLSFPLTTKQQFQSFGGN